MLSKVLITRGVINKTDREMSPGVIVAKRKRSCLPKREDAETMVVADPQERISQDVGGAWSRKAASGFRIIMLNRDA